MTTTGLDRLSTWSALRDNKSVMIRAAVLVAAVYAVYGTDLSIVFTKAFTFTAGNITNYVLVIPMLILFILHRKRRILVTTASWQENQRGNSLRLDDVLGAALCSIAVIVHVMGSTTLYSLEYHLLSLPVFVAGGIMLLFNIATLRQSIIVIILLAYLQPPPAEFLGELAADLSWSSAVLVQYALSSIGVPIGLDASFGAPALIVEDANGTRIPFYIGEPSSGTYSMLGLSVFSLFVAYVLRGKLWKRALVFVIGFPVFYALNVARIALIISIWYTSGEVAAESFHVVSGMVMSAVGTLILLLFADLVPKLGVRAPLRNAEGCQSCEKSLAVGESLCLLCGRLLKPLKSRITGLAVGRMVLIMVISSLVIAAQIAAFRSVGSLATSKPTLYNVDIASIKGPETTSYFFPEVPGWDLAYAYRDDAVEKILNQDAALAFRYVSNATGSGASSGISGKPSVIAGLQISRTLHTWEGSLLVYPSKFGRPTATVLDLKWVDITGDKQGRYFVYQKPGSTTTEAVIYWTDKRELRFGTGLESRNVQIILWANVDSLANLGAIDSNRDLVKTEEILLSLARPIVAYWDEISISTASARTLDAIITQQPYIPLGITVVVASLLSFAILSKNRSLHRLNRKLYDQVKVGEEKLILDAIAGSARGGKQLLTGEAIVGAHPDLHANSPAAPRVIDMFKQIRNTGLIREWIQSDSDEPLLVWKPSFKVDRMAGKKKQDAKGADF